MINTELRSFLMCDMFKKLGPESHISTVNVTLSIDSSNDTKVMGVIFRRHANWKLMPDCERIRTNMPISATAAVLNDNGRGNSI